MGRTDNVTPMIHVCRDCNPSALCVECVWLGKLLHQEVTLDKIERPDITYVKE